MSLTVFPCYAPGDRETAARVASFLEAGADVRVFLEEGQMRPGEDLAAKAREGRMADIVLVLFSRNSLPQPWRRPEWEGALRNEPAEEGVRIGFIRCDDCVPPGVLTPRFELPGGLRDLKRWIRTQTMSGADAAIRGDLAEGIEAIAQAIADRPGTAAIDNPDLVLEFVRAFHEDFDAILWLECGDRSPAALMGDLAEQLGLRLECEPETGLARLRQFCSSRRFLLVLEDVPDAAACRFAFGGRSSALISSRPPAAKPIPAESLRAIQKTFAHLNDTCEWPEVCRLGRLGRKLSGDGGRMAECFELMEQWHQAALARGDRRVLDETAREMAWILEGLGAPGRGAAPGIPKAAGIWRTNASAL